MCFLSRTMQVHIRLLRCNILFVVYNNCPGQKDPQILHQLKTYGTWWSGNLTLSPKPVTTIAELWQWVQDAWDSLLQDDIQHLYDHLHARIHTCISATGGTLCIDVTLGTPYRDVCFIWSEFIIYSYNDKTTYHINFQYSELGVAFFAGSVLLFL